MSVLSVNGNGFYCPSNKELKLFIKPDAKCIIDLQNAIFPLKLTLIGYQNDDQLFFRQDFIAENENQVRHIYKYFTKYAAVIPTACLNEKGLTLPSDYIIDMIKISEYEKIE